MNDAAGVHRMEQPRKRALFNLCLHARPALIRSQAVPDNVSDVGRQNVAQMVLAHRQGQLERRIVEINDGAVFGQFHCRVWIKLGERGQFLQIGLRAVTLHRHAQRCCYRKKEMDFVAGKTSSLGGMHAQNTVRKLARQDGHGHAADNAVLHRQWCDFEPRLAFGILHHHGFAAA